MGREQTNLRWLEMWFGARCNGGWEHGQGVVIETTDNPGWWVKIDIEAQVADERILEVAGDPPSEANGFVGGAEWMVCQIRNGKFDGAGDASKLSAILECFRDWIREDSSLVKGAVCRRP